MRDRSGLGNIYFDDLFTNGSIPTVSLIYYSVNILISLFNLALTPILFFTICVNCGYHRNLRTVFSNLYIAFFLVAFGNCVYSILVLARVSDRKHDNIFYVFRFGASIGPGIWRSTFVAIVFERAAATIWYKSYENRAPLWLGVVLFLFAQTGIMIPICFFLCKFKYLDSKKIFLMRLPYFVNTAICTTIDLTSVFVILILFWCNKSMRKIKLYNSDIKLSERYQIIENLRVLKLMAPLIILGTIFDFGAASLAALQSYFDFNTQLMYPMYLFVTNLYVSIALYYSLIKDQKIRHKVMSSFGIMRKLSTSINPDCHEGFIRDVDGKILILSDTPENHFKQLEELWKKNGKL